MTHDQQREPEDEVPAWACLACREREAREEAEWLTAPCERHAPQEVLEPITQAGPGLAIAINDAAAEFEARSYIVEVADDGGVQIHFPMPQQRPTVHLGPAVALNVRGLLEAINQGTIR